MSRPPGDRRARFKWASPGNSRRVSMLAVTILIYLTGVAVTAVGAFMAGRILRDPRGRTDHPLPVIVMAGIAWPLLVVGIAQLGGLSLLMKSR